MSIELQITRFKCGTCKHVYDTKAEADRCESRPVAHDRGVKVGDVVLITAGEGAGKKCRVENIFAIDKDWGHYQWDRYWHTVAVDGKILDGIGSRMLTFDSYAVIP